MKKLTLNIIFALFCIQFVHAQTKQKLNLAEIDKAFDSGSNIIIPVLSNELINNLHQGVLARFYGCDHNDVKI